MYITGSTMKPKRSNKQIIPPIPSAELTTTIGKSKEETNADVRITRITLTMDVLNNNFSEFAEALKIFLSTTRHCIAPR